MASTFISHILSKCSKKRKGGPAAFSSFAVGPDLDVVVHREFHRMRPEAQRRDLILAFVSYPSLDQLRSEYVALEQELMIVLKCLERLVEAARQAWNVRQFLGRK